MKLLHEIRASTEAGMLEEFREFKESGSGIYAKEEVPAQQAGASLGYRVGHFARGWFQEHP
jgi:hypothetical protein